MFQYVDSTFRESRYDIGIRAEIVEQMAQNGVEALLVILMLNYNRLQAQIAMLKPISDV